MAHYFGVKCKKTGEPVALNELDPTGPNQITFTALPLDPFTCPACGETHEYVAKEGIEFEADSSGVRKIRP